MNAVRQFSVDVLEILVCGGIPCLLGADDILDAGGMAKDASQAKSKKYADSFKQAQRCWLLARNAFWTPRKPSVLPGWPLLNLPGFGLSEAPL